MSSGPDLFRRLCHARQLLVEEDGGAALSVESVARASGMSRFHFIRRYGAVFGVTPHQARIAARMERAKRLLARGEHTVTEVCFEVGCSSLGTFSALFSRHVGEAPSSYQRRMRRLVSSPGLPATLAFPGCFSLMLHLPAGAFGNFREAGRG